jgi:pilus assembly protein Flp/PilA
MFNLMRQAIGVSLGGFLADESGATAIEYALIASGIAVAIASTVMTLGSSVRGLYANVSSAMN